MCTLMVLHNVHDNYPLIIAANRDEAYDRQSEEPDFIQLLPLAVVAPRDVLRGGTWMGAAQGGWFVGLTNQDAGGTLSNKKSRGEVVRNCLLMGDHRQVTRYLVGLNPKDYNPFNLVFGRPEAMFLCKVHHDIPIDLEIISQGVTIITNDTISNKYSLKEIRATMSCKKIGRQDDEDTVINKLEEILSTHDEGSEPHQSLCIHDEVGKFGTRSSSVVFVTNNGDIDYFHSEGHLCTSAGLSLNRHLTSIDFDSLDDYEELSLEDVELID